MTLPPTGIGFDCDDIFCYSAIDILCCCCPAAIPEPDIKFAKGSAFAVLVTYFPAVGYYAAGREAATAAADMGIATPTPLMDVCDEILPISAISGLPPFYGCCCYCCCCCFTGACVVHCKPFKSFITGKTQFKKTQK